MSHYKFCDDSEHIVFTAYNQIIIHTLNTQIVVNVFKSKYYYSYDAFLNIKLKEERRISIGY